MWSGDVQEERWEERDGNEGMALLLEWYVWKRCALYVVAVIVVVEKEKERECVRVVEERKRARCSSLAGELVSPFFNHMPSCKADGGNEDVGRDDMDAVGVWWPPQRHSTQLILVIPSVETLSCHAASPVWGLRFSLFAYYSPCTCSNLNPS